jgi:hypothetical protein
MTGVHHHAQTLIEMGSCMSFFFFVWLALTLNPLDHHLLSSWDYRFEALCLGSLAQWFLLF